MIARTLLLAALVASAGCFELDRVNGPVLGYESDPDACNDGRDNDRDGMIDCRDSSCIGSGLCGVIIVEGARPEPENTFLKCTDRIDNDQDGNWDCGDRNCQAIQELCCVTEFSDYFCADGVDNDDNGFRDCGDFSCRNNPFVTVCDFEAVCDDGRDNDEDDLEDCDDPDCAGIGDCPPPPDPIPEDTIALCSDGIDNDRNGFRDCGDFSCSMAADPEVRVFCAARLENNVERCSDGEDNDGNGFTDCADFSCSRSTDPDLIALCESPDPVDEEDGFDECKNGLDDDGDGFPDCADFSCRDSRQEREIDGVMVVASPCQESITVTDPEDNLFLAIQEAIDRCTNGLDEDEDGFTDCDDWDCHWNPLMRPGADVAIAAGRPPEEGYCQGWRFLSATREWVFSAPSDDRNRPLYCRGY
ncbi:MAG: hypothetical protein JJ863_37535 [Deltaproteobacteria bacterium]|nr:hypothetical protein [Deltaproteobacteria bacterium]